MKPQIVASVLICLAVLFIRCGKDNKKWDSDFIVHNTLDNEIEVYSSAYTSSQINGQQLVAFTDVVAPNTKYVLRNIDARQDPEMDGIFHEIKIYRGGVESPVNALENSRWTKAKVNDDKLEYTLKVDTTYFP